RDCPTTEEPTMTSETIAPPATEVTTDDRPRLSHETTRGLRCRNCGREEALGPSYVCPACFGPLEVTYDYEAIRARISPDTITARPPGIWRYLELLPVEAPPPRGLAVGSSPLLPGARIGRELGLEHLWLKDDTRNPTLSFKDRVVAVATARALTFGFDKLALVGLIEPRPVRFVGAQAAGCSPVATAFARGSDEIAPVRNPDTIVKSLAIGSPADGRYALDIARRTGGSVEAVEDATTA